MNDSTSAPTIEIPGDALSDAIAPGCNAGPGTAPASAADFAECALDTLANDLSILRMAVSSEEGPSQTFLYDALYSLATRAEGAAKVTSVLRERERAKGVQ